MHINPRPTSRSQTSGSDPLWAESYPDPFERRVAASARQSSASVSRHHGVGLHRPSFSVPSALCFPPALPEAFLLPILDAGELTEYYPPSARLQSDRQPFSSYPMPTKE